MSPSSWHLIHIVMMMEGTVMDLMMLSTWTHKTTSMKNLGMPVAWIHP